jgi:hypothetical protein
VVCHNRKYEEPVNGEEIERRLMRSVHQKEKK